MKIKNVIHPTMWFFFYFLSPNILLHLSVIMLCAHRITCHLPDSDEANTIARQASKLIQNTGHTISSETLDALLDQEDTLGDTFIDLMRDLPNPHDTDTPSPSQLFNPDLLAHPDSCHREYSQPCPANFFIQHWNETASTCVPESYYEGSCQESIVFLNDDTDWSIKRDFALQCQTNWPCTVCQRDYRESCPIHFTPGDNDICIPTEHYKGPCTNPLNSKMIDIWSVRCKAFFPCAKSLSSTSLTSLSELQSIQRLQE